MPLPAVPYRGLEPYRFCDQAIFFERELETERLVRLITMYRGSLLYGESGVGKSSLINAGFIPRAVAEGLAVERLRVQPRPDQEFVVERIAESDVPGHVLPSFLISSSDEHRTTFSPAEFLTAVRSCPSDRGLLIFDQFEEFLTLASDGTERTGRALESQQRILETVVTLLQHRDFARIRVLFVFREDYLAKFDRLFYFCPELTDRFMRLTPPAASTLHRLLRGPFESPLIPPGYWEREISEADALALERELRPREAGRAINLSQVQIAALQLWRSNQPAELLARRGADGLIEDFLNGQLATLREARPVAETLLALMITRDGTRRVVSETELLDDAGKERIPAPRAREAVDHLVRSAHLVRRDYNRGATTFEIVSEFLVPWIRRLKLEREAIKARNAWLKRAGVALLVLLLALGVGYYWKYTTLSRDLLVRNAQDALAAERAGNAALRKEVYDLQDALRATGAERERKLAEVVSDRTRALDEQKRVNDDLRNQLTMATDDASRERDAKTKEQAQTKLLSGELARLEERLKQLEKSAATDAAVNPPLTSGEPAKTAPPAQLQQPPAPLPAYQKPTSLQRSVSGHTIIVNVVDQYGEPLRDRIEIRLQHNESKDRREAKGVDGQTPIEIAGLSKGTYSLEIKPASYLPAKVNVTTNTGFRQIDVAVAVDLNKPVAPKFPIYQDLDPRLRRALESSQVEGASGEALYLKLGDLRKAGLLNLFTKMNAFQTAGSRHVWDYVRELIEIHQDSVMVRVDASLREFVRGSADTRFRAVSQGLHAPPPGFTHAGSFKSLERRGLLQLSFFVGTQPTELIVDAEIDESSSGVREALRKRTNPYVIHQILWKEHNLDSLYRLTHSSNRQDKN